MHFDNGFIQFYSRPLSFGLILSYNIDHILFSRKIGILAEKSKQRQFCSANITMKKKVQKKWSIPLWIWRKILQNKHKEINLWHIVGGVICRTKSAIFDWFEKRLPNNTVSVPYINILKKIIEVVKKLLEK